MRQRRLSIPVPSVRADVPAGMASPAADATSAAGGLMWRWALLMAFRASCMTLGLVPLAAALVNWIVYQPFPGDTVVYLEAGHRLNAGGLLYAPHDFGPGYASVAIFSPPLVGALFRFVALIPDSERLWLAAMAVCVSAAVVYVILRSTPTGLVVLLVAPWLGILIEVGNLDSLVIAGSIAAWELQRRGWQRESGVVLGLLASLKLTPAALVVWALATRRWRIASWSIATGLLLAAVAMLATEPNVFLQFVSLTLVNYGPSSGPLSLATAAAAHGIPFAEWLPRLALMGGLAAVVVLRHRPALAWAVASITMAAASPVASWHTYALLLIGLAPLASAGYAGVSGRSLRRMFSSS